MTEEAFVILYPNQSFASAIGVLLRLAYPNARVTDALLVPTPVLSVELCYDENTDWLAAACELADAAGMQLRKVITSGGQAVWVIAYGCGHGWFK